MLDFHELAPDGEGLEQLVRELALALGYRAKWSGRGADGGRDLLLEEPGDALLGAKTRKWVISCKHMAHAKDGAGRSVNGEDVGSIGGIVDAVAQHDADGFLLVCSTQPSSALVSRLESIERTKGVHTHVWDGVELERMLATPRGWAVAQRFFPVSAEASGWKVFATSEPNRFIGITRGFYLRVANRHGSAVGFPLKWIDERLDRVASIALPVGHEIRPRGVFYDDKHGGFVWYLDYLHGYRSWRREEIEPPMNEYTLRQRLGDDGVSFDDGQYDNFEITFRKVNRGHDAYDADHYRYYEGVPSYV
ncbi:restriction endonuclease [Streptomyces sp. CB04723]|uniref:restriction endonuclease n=1 Tax=Streptomyces TaxID=1883 RepID=UPI0015C4A93C|nr:restriction endonuclease [Streptomyces sp. CB04723]QLG33445.1 restriction endonuclease [Streptomyces sp. CB04723]